MGRKNQQDERDAADLAVLRSHVAQLAEHFDTVQVMVTRHDPEQDGTVAYRLGSGNTFARYGQAREYVLAMENMNPITALPDEEDDDDDDGEDL